MMNETKRKEIGLNAAETVNGGVPRTLMVDFGEMNLEELLKWGTAPAKEGGKPRKTL